MRSCIFYTLLLPVIYTLLWLYMDGQQPEFAPPTYLVPLIIFVGLTLPSLVCCIGWLWVQRRPILSVETPYICFLLPLGFMMIANITSVYAFGYDGINTIASHVISLGANAICSAALVGLTWFLRLLWPLFTAPRQWK